MSTESFCSFWEQETFSCVDCLKEGSSWFYCEFCAKCREYSYIKVVYPEKQLQKYWFNTVVRVVCVCVCVFCVLLSWFGLYSWRRGRLLRSFVFLSLNISKIWRTKTKSLSFSRCLPLVLLCLRFSLLFHPLLLSNRILRASTLNIPVSSTSSRGFYDERNTESPGSPRRIFLPNRPVIA